MKRYDIGDKVVARDGGALTIIKVDKRNAELPQMSRYTVQQADGTVIENFPAYLIR